MKRFEFLEHTADAKLRAYGENLGDAFANSALGMASLMYDSKMVAALEIRNIEVHGTDIKQLLYNFLEEFLFMQDSENFLIHGFVKLPVIGNSDGKFFLRAEVIGDRINEIHEFSPAVKAVTYNEMEISEKPIYVQVVLDT